MTDFNVQQLSQLDRSRFSAYKANLDFYNGEQWADSSLRSSTKNRQLVFNYAKIAVDKVTSYLMEGLNFACEPSENQTLNIKNQKLNSKDQRDTARKAEKVIYDVYHQNNLQELAIPTTAHAGDVASAILAKMRLTGKRGVILIPPNCGQELFDVVQLSDSMANQSAVKFRVVGLRFEYNPKQARYEHRLIL